MLCSSWLTLAMNSSSVLPPQRQIRGAIAFIEHAANECGQLSGEMSCLICIQPVAQRMEHGPQAELTHDFFTLSFAAFSSSITSSSVVCSKSA
jgi:hypothetical protein